MSRKVWCGIFASALIAGGCGGKSGDGSLAKTTGGDAIRTASGQAVTREAHDKWTVGVELFQRYEREGWNDRRCGEAEKKFEDAISAQGGAFTEAIYMVGLVKSRCGDARGARRAYNRALESNQSFCKARVAVGLLDLESGNSSAARSAFQRSIRDDPQCTSGYVNMAIMQREAGGAQEKEALRNLRRALAIESDYLPAFNQMALLYYNRGLVSDNKASLDLAEVVCRQAQLIDRTYAPIYNTWGLVKIRKGDVIEALRYFERAIKLDANMYEAQMNFGQITLSFRGYEDARKAFVRASELKNGSYEAVIGLGAALRGLERFPEAKTQYERAMELDRRRPEAYFNLGLLFQDYMGGTVGDLQKAKRFYEQFLSRAGGGKQFSDAVKSVRARCQNQSSRRRGKKRRRRRSDCRPGRIQNIDTAIAAIREGEAMQREAERMQREAGQQK